MSRFASVGSLTILSVLIFANLIHLFGQPESIYRLPIGTRISLKPDTEVNSKVSSVDDTFLATVTRPVTIRETVMLRVGTVIEGRISGVSPAAGGGQGGKLEVVFEILKISNQTRRIEGVLVTPISAESSKPFTFLSVLGGVAAGTAIGAGSKTSHGALVGAAIGAGIGTTIALLRKGKDAKLRKGQEFEIELKKEVVLPVLDY